MYIGNCNYGAYKGNRILKEDSYCSTGSCAVRVDMYSTFFAALSYFNIAFVWYYLVAVIFAALIVAFICTHGWDALIEIFKRYNRKDMEV